VLSSLQAATYEGKWWLPKNILIADSSGPARIATRRALECHPGLEVCGEAVDGLDAVEKARQLNPDLITLALGMPRLNGFDVARKLRAMSIEVPTILFTFYADAIPPQDAHTAVVCKTDPQALKQHIEKQSKSRNTPHRCDFRPPATSALNSPDFLRGTVNELQFPVVLAAQCFARNTICPT